MPRRPKLRSFRPVAEQFTQITWDEPNRVEHEARRPFPPWSVLPRADWSRACKRKDVEHRGPPDRFQALVQLSLTGGPVVLFVAYTKANQALHVITTRMATSHEREVFFRHHASAAPPAAPVR